MKEVKYLLNGKYFRDHKVFVSSSDGLFDELKPKKVDSYDWPEYNGQTIDISIKPIFEAREFELEGWVEGDTC